MAILRELVEVLARTTGVPESTVFAFGRFTREAGLISQKGRGRAAAEMSTTDAANLFLALGATDVTRDAGIAVKKFSSLQGWTPDGFYENPVDEHIQAWLMPVITKPVTWNNEEPVYLKDFGSFVQFLLAESVSGGLTKFLRGIPVLDERSLQKVRSSEGFMDRPGYFFSLRRMLQEGATTKRADQVIVGARREVGFEFVFDRVNPFVYFKIKTFHVAEEDLLTLAFHDPKGDRPELDLRVEARLSQTSIQALGATLRGLKIPSKLKHMEEIETFLFSEGTA
jgi:hypothetical protein